MAGKTKAQREADAIALAKEQETLEAERRAGLTQEERDAEDAAAAEEAAALEAESKAAQEALAKKHADAAALRAKAGEATGETMYSKADVKDMLQQALAEFAAKQKKTEQELMEDPEDMFKQKKVRLPRFQGKFVTHFKNINTDEYFPDLVITSFDVWDEKTRQNSPWVTLVFQDNTELSVPLTTALKRAQTVYCDLIEVLQKDTSYSQGKVEKMVVDGYSKSGGGIMVNAKIKQFEYTYKLKLPPTQAYPEGEIVIATRDVINW